MLKSREFPTRRSIRLRDFDYTQAGAYVVTLVTQDRRCVFGAIEDGQVVLSPVGLIAAGEWERTASIRPNVELDAFVVMPSHIHGIIVLAGGEMRARQRLAPTASARMSRGPVMGSLGAIIGQYKSVVSKRVAALPGYSGGPLWQRGFYEHVVRDETDLARIRQYITDNPSRWDDDVENPAAALSQLGGSHVPPRAPSRPA